MTKTIILLTIANYWLREIINLEWRIIAIPLPGNKNAVIKLTAEIQNTGDITCKTM